jgi:tetratricopeptide (TPR) repeat protein
LLIALSWHLGRGFEPLIDRTEIFAFEEWWARIEGLIARADTVVFVLSPDAVASDVALREVSFAASLNKRFAPIVCRPVEDKQVPEALARLNFIFFDDVARFEESADRLADALNTDISWIRQHTEFGEQARRWASAKRPAGLLLRSPVLEQAERWIASRPRGAPAPTEQTQTFVRESRQAATRRRNILTGSLAAGLVLALGLAAMAYRERGIAVEERGIAEQNEAQAKEERDQAERNFKLAQNTAEHLVFDITQGLRDVQGMRADTVRKILETARATIEQLGRSAPDNLPLQHSRGMMLRQFGETYLTLGNLDQALQAYRDFFATAERLAKADPGNAIWQSDLALSYWKVGEVLAAQGKLSEALKAYRDSSAIADRLTEADQGNAFWQTELALSYWRVGDVLGAQGKLSEALQAYATASPSLTAWPKPTPAMPAGRTIFQAPTLGLATPWRCRAN